MVSGKNLARAPQGIGKLLGGSRVMKKFLAVAVLMSAVGFLTGCNSSACPNPCAPCCPEPAYQSPCCPAPSGGLSGAPAQAAPAAGGGGMACGAGGKACG